MANKQSEPVKLIGKDGQVIAQTAGVNFGDVELTRNENPTPFKGGRSDGKSVTAASYQLPFMLAGGAEAVITGNVYGRLQDDGTVKFNVALPKGIRMKDADGEAFRAHVNAAIIAWPGRAKAWAAAHKGLTNPPVKAGSKAAEVEAALSFAPVVDEPTPASPTVPTSAGTTTTA